ncbi:MAG: family 43 glycosylhydrolase [Bacteroidales bacterium]
MKTVASLVFLLLYEVCACGQNPISPAGVYLADPSARVWNDGRLYIYGSLDEDCSYYCSTINPVMRTADMKSWEYFGGSFRSAGEGDQIPYNDEVLYAPDAAFKDGRYFLFYCQPDRQNAEGVAWSDSPEGPFVDGKALNVGSHNQIDPAVFIDDDGQAYYLWGQFSLKMARLKVGMTELDTSTIRDSIITEQDHHFHEGAFLAKRNGLYYLVYADLSRGDIPTCIGYATAASPFGPYTYRGVIIDNNHCNPNNWNNHGSIAEFNGQWYVFYHRSTHGCNTMRKACAEPIMFMPDGTIPEVEMTSQGASGPLDSESIIEAEWACILNGNVRIKQTDSKTEALCEMQSGDKAAYKYIDFRKGTDSITIRILPPAAGGSLIVSADKPWHKRLALIQMEGITDREWQIFTIPVARIEGIHAVWLHYYGEEGTECSIDWFRFR